MATAQISSWSSVEEHHHRQGKINNSTNHNQVSELSAVDRNNCSQNTNNRSKACYSPGTPTQEPNFVSLPVGIDTAFHDATQHTIKNCDDSYHSNKSDYHNTGSDYFSLKKDSNVNAPQSVREDVFISSDKDTGQEMNFNHREKFILPSSNREQRKQQLGCVSETVPYPNAVKATQAHVMDIPTVDCDTNRVDCDTNGVDCTLGTSTQANPMLHIENMKLKRELEQERNKSAKLEKRVNDLSEMCEVMEEEAKLTQELSQVYNETKNSIGNLLSDDGTYSRINHEAEVGKHQTTECLPTNTTASDHDNNLIDRECLEQAIKLQVEKRMESEAELASLKKNLSSNNKCPDPGPSFSSSRTIITNFFKEVKNLVNQLKISSCEDKRIGPVQEQLADFDELLTAFLQETDGLDGDDGEKVMDRKDVIWFLNELKLRFKPIQESCEKDTQSMISFADKLAVLTEKAIINESNLNQGESPAVQVIAELAIAKLEGKIVQLKENLLVSAQNIGENSNSPNHLSMRCLLRDYNVVSKKYKHLESRHSSLACEMQDSIRSKDKKIIFLKNALKKNGNMDQLQDTKSPFENDVYLEDAQRQIEERNLLIDEMRVEIERLSVQNKSSVLNEADKIRLRYLEGIVHELERKLAVATGSSPSKCKYGSTSLYNIDNSWSCTHDESFHLEDIMPSNTDKKSLEDKVKEVSGCLAQSEHDRVTLENEIKIERKMYEEKFSDIQHLLKYIQAPPEVLNSLQQI